MTPVTFALKNTSRFPTGTTVNAYDAGNFDFWQGVGPLGTIVDSQTATATGTTFSLEPGPYWFTDNAAPDTTHIRAVVGADGDVDGIAGLNDLYADALVVGVELGTPALATDDYIVASVSMKATAYTLAHSTLTIPRNITVTHTAVSTADTRGALVVTGTNRDGDVITESITIASGTVTAGTKAFKTVTSCVTADWVVASGADSIKIGFGNLLGLDRCLSAASQVFGAFLNYAGVVPTITVDSDEVEKNTVDLSVGTYDGSKPARVLLIP